MRRRKMRSVKEKIPLSKVSHSVRAAQAILQYGVGAMVDFQDQTLMTAAPEYWQEQIVEVNDERFAKLLHVNRFGMPGNSSEIKYREGISYVRFPEWYFCPKCRRFQSLIGWIHDYKDLGKPSDVKDDPYMVKHMRCPKCRQGLVVARIVTVCEHGHIDDFPWVKWVHARSWGGSKPVCSNPKLTFKTGASSTEGLDGLEITCETCRAKTSLSGAFDKDAFKNLDEKTENRYKFRCTGRHPWKGSFDECGLYPVVKQRGSSAVYYPVTRSSLVIPPYSLRLNTQIEESNAFSKCKNVLSTIIKSMKSDSADYISELKYGIIQNAANEISLEISVPESLILPILMRKWVDNSEHKTETDASLQYRFDEYDALSGNVEVKIDKTDDFYLERTQIDDYNIPYVNKVVLIHKIREVQALVGFTRINPVERDEDMDKNKKIVSVKSSETDWYPAYEVRGEGIFVEFNSAAIAAWAAEHSEIKERTARINEAYRASYVGRESSRIITSKFLLLHTIAHLLIKQLSFECGYSIASLRERIYCSESTDGKEMSGVLIYTASGDSEGTLGGLVRQGRSDTFPAVFRKAIESAVTCSNDPVCSLSMGQGRESLNLSACYSCALIPETSCEEYNVFLDRAMIVGTCEKTNIGLYSKCVRTFNGWNQADSFRMCNPVRASEPLKQNLLFVSGTNTSEMTYSEIWKSLLPWLDDPAEKERIARFAEQEFVGCEKPFSNCQIKILPSTEVLDCDLVWKESKIVLFTSNNEEEYQVALGTDWTCFSTTDPELTVDKLISGIRKEK